MSEADIMRQYQLDASAAGDRLFRNNVGTGWVGQATIRREKDGSTTAIIRYARPLHAGLATGSGDLIGWSRVVITQEMVGSTVAVFTSVEVKTETGRVSVAQENWRQAVADAGGIASVRKG